MIFSGKSVVANQKYKRTSHANLDYKQTCRYHFVQVLACGGCIP
jgi:hypothetical protein